MSIDTTEKIYKTETDNGPKSGRGKKFLVGDLVHATKYAARDRRKWSCIVKGSRLDVRCNKWEYDMEVVEPLVHARKRFWCRAHEFSLVPEQNAPADTQLRLDLPDTTTAKPKPAEEPTKAEVVTRVLMPRPIEHIALTEDKQPRKNRQTLAPGSIVVGNAKYGLKFSAAKGEVLEQVKMPDGNTGYKVRFFRGRSLAGKTLDVYPKQVNYYAPATKEQPDEPPQAPQDQPAHPKPEVSVTGSTADAGELSAALKRIATLEQQLLVAEAAYKHEIALLKSNNTLLENIINKAMQ